jgi:hypothetical protein
MLQERLAALEDVAQPYIDSGYVVMSQTDSSLTLMRARPRFSVLLFCVLLVVFWPAALIYSVVNRNGRDEAICLRVTSQGYIEATGNVSESEGQRVSGRVFLFIVLASIFLTALSLFLILR